MGGGSRLSGAAAMSAGLAGLSVAGCLVVGALSVIVSPTVLGAVIVLPVLGLTGAGLGAAGLRAIRRSGGTLTGRPLAIIGLFVGIISAVVQGSMGGSMVATYLTMRSTLAPAAQRVLSAMSARDDALVRTMLAPATASALSDGRIEAFIGAFERECGPFRRAAFDVRVMNDAFTRVRLTGGAPRGPAPAGDPMKPLRLEGDSGEALAWVTLDQDALKAD
ncbi:MAG TPA: hypothetical protein DEB06_07385, partial [Phycisphaerales bacterium]|nr:hypothetical protein [Phycisphaerales bacterium]